MRGGASGAAGKVLLWNVVVQNEGKGVGSRLAAQVLAELRRRGVKIVPQCEFMAKYIARHPEGG